MDQCVICGEYTPEGQDICLLCQQRYSDANTIQGAMPKRVEKERSQDDLCKDR